MTFLKIIGAVLVGCFLYFLLCLSQAKEFPPDYDDDLKIQDHEK